MRDDRSIGFGGVGGIWWRSINDYADRLGIDDPDEFRRFNRLLRVMDDAYLAIVNKPKNG